MKLLKVDTLTQARERLYGKISWELRRTEEVMLSEASGRVLSEDVTAEHPLPSFRRSAVDGYAVVAADTQGASESLPAFLDIVEEVEIGHPAASRIVSGTCAYVPTGGMIPEGADAMVMVEYCELFDEGSTAVYDAVSPGRGMVQIGEDVEAGACILKRGTVLGAAEIGALAGNGIGRVRVYEKLRLTILSTGDELVELGKPLSYGQIYDINTPGLRELAGELGFQVVRTQVIPDQEELLVEALKRGMAESDVVAVSGGSSQGKKDMTARLLDELASPGVLTHGLALKPGKPTIAAVDEKSETILLGLPGHPAAAMLVFRLVGSWLEEMRTGKTRKPAIPALMESNVPAAPGKDTCLMVKLLAGEEPGVWLARPIFGKSGLMRTLTQADGYVAIPLGKEGLQTGERVLVEPF